MQFFLFAVLALTAAVADSVRGQAAESPSFEPGDISIGEPIALPFVGPRSGAAAADSPPLQPAAQPERASPAGPEAAPDLTPIRDRLSPLGLRPTEGSVSPPNQAPPGAATATTAMAGQGWLGLAVAESSVAGRWIVATVAPVGPAAEAGILPGDEVRGINGLPLRNADEVSQAITAIAPGQIVGMAIARGEQVRDVQLTATARPAVAPFAAAPPIAAVAAAAAPAAPPPSDLGGPSPNFAAAEGIPTVPTRPAPRFAGPAAASPAASIPPVATAAPPVTPRDEAGARAFAPARTAPITETADGRPSGGRTALGVRTVPVDDAMQSRFRLPAASGAYVIGVVQDLPASRAGVPPGSVIVSLDARPVRSPDELTQLVTAGPVGRPVALEYVLPGGASQRADVVLQTLEKPMEAALTGSTEPRATGVPALEPSPGGTIARRPVSRLDASTAAAIRDEIRWLRTRLTILEQRLDSQNR